MKKDGHVSSVWLGEGKLQSKPAMSCVRKQESFQRLNTKSNVHRNQLKEFNYPIF